MRLRNVETTFNKDRPQHAYSLNHVVLHVYDVFPLNVHVFPIL